MSRSALALLPVCMALLLPLAAHAEDDTASRAPPAVLNRYLQVLQTDPDSASDACVAQLKELHKTQDIVATAEAGGKEEQTAVAKDVLESDYDDANEVCGTDARTLCRTKGNTLAKLPALCQTLAPPRDPNAPEDE
ncbi:hypothetical protein [Brytella acorum]|uniref:Secreted protein n=1 Tax=Brytella acorum TaxID=2959299 RepID=A0AA35V900_9PROT|nr:hypothetical protein [Brytella acorum]MDF3623595.1 hypothetical protein [Brytella acorum]CAI9119987.1 hypothetical protein LMG32879_000813 [Brytella acorum]